MSWKQKKYLHRPGQAQTFLMAGLCFRFYAAKLCLASWDGYSVLFLGWGYLYWLPVLSSPLIISAAGFLRPSAPFYWGCFYSLDWVASILSLPIYAV